MANGRLDPQELVEALRRVNEEQRKLAQSTRDLFDAQAKAGSSSRDLAKDLSSINSVGGKASATLGQLGQTAGTDFAGGMNSAAKGLNVVSSSLSLLPGAAGLAGAALGAVIGFLGAAGAEFARMRAQATQAFTSILTGVQDIGTGVAQAQLDVMANRLNELTREGQNFSDAWRQAFREAEQAARNARNLLQGTDIQSALGIRRFIINQAQTRLTGQEAAAGGRTFGLQAQSQALAQGMTPEAAIDRQERANAEWLLYTQLLANGVPQARAMARAQEEIAVQADRLAAARARERLVQGGVQSQLRNREDRAGNRLAVSNLLLLRQQSATGELIVEDTAARNEAQEQYNRNLITSVQLTERLQQIRQNEQVQRAVQIGQQVNQSIEQTRRPLERLARARQALEQQAGEFMARPGGGQALVRAQADQLRQFIQTARPQERLLGATEEGTAAAAVASARAEIQERAEDPAIALRAAIEADRMATEAQTRSNERLITTYQQLMAEGVV